MSLIKIAIPMSASVLLENSAGIVQGMLLGNVSKDQSAQIIAASSLSDVTTAEVSLTLIIGLRYAVDTMCARSVGAKQYTQLWLYAQAGLLAMTYCVPLIAITIANGAPILVFLGQDPKLASLASVFMRIGLFSIPFTMSLTIMTCVLTAQGITVPFTVASLSSYAVTLPLAYWLGFHTSMGYLGIPTSMVINVVVQNAIIGSVLLKNSVFLESWPGWQLTKAQAILRKLGPLGLASVIMVFSQNVSFNVVSLLCGLLPNPASALSSSSIALNWIILCYMPLTGFFTGGAVRVGRALGGGQPRRALIACRVTLVSMLAASCVAMVFCVCFADAFAHAYTTDAGTAKAAIHLIYVMLPIIPLTACNLTAAAIFRACGKQMFSAELNIATTLVLAIPVGCFLAFNVSWGPTGLWAGQILGFIVFAIVAEAWVLRQDWKELAHTARLNAHLQLGEGVDEPLTEPLLSKVATMSLPVTR